MAISCYFEKFSMSLGMFAIFFLRRTISTFLAFSQLFSSVKVWNLETLFSAEDAHIFSYEFIISSITTYFFSTTTFSSMSGLVNWFKTKIFSQFSERFFAFIGRWENFFNSYLKIRRTKYFVLTNKRDFVSTVAFWIRKHFNVT